MHWILDGCKREAEIGHSLSLNGDVDGESLCLAMTSGLTVVLRGLNCGEGSANSSFDVNGVGGRVTNCKHGIESKYEMDKVGSAQKRSQEKVGMGDVGICRKRRPDRLRVVGGRWAGWGTEGRPDSSKDVVVESEAKV